MPTPSRPNVAEFYEGTVLPVLMARLDDVFPEFGWRRDPRGWRATNDEFTHARLGARADRVVCHGEAPCGLPVHGEGPLLWTTYANDGAPARGRDFIAAVRAIAERAGVDASALDRPPAARQQQAALLEDAFTLALDELTSARGQAARGYLVGERGFPLERLADAALGVMPNRNRLLAGLGSRGHSRRDIEASGLLADGRWAGRVVGAWRDEHGSIGTLWARTAAGGAATAGRYLYLRGATRTGLPPYGLAEALSRGVPEVLHLVEGVLDVHHLRARGISNVAALGGTAAGVDMFERLARLHVPSVVLCLDNDDVGRAATARAIDAAVRADRSPDVFVIDGSRLGDAKDADELLRQKGGSAWRHATAQPTCAVAWRAVAALQGPRSELDARVGLRAAGQWLGSLPPRFAIEQDTALAGVAIAAGHDPAVVRRAFRARYWPAPRQAVAPPLPPPDLR